MKSTNSTNDSSGSTSDIPEAPQCLLERADLFCISFFVLTDLLADSEEWLQWLFSHEYRVAQKKEHFDIAKALMCAARSTPPMFFLTAPSLDWVSTHLSSHVFSLPIHPDVRRYDLFSSVVCAWLALMCSLTIRPCLL
jgi:hypothetical protein